LRAASVAVLVFALVAIGAMALIQFAATSRRPVANPASYWVVDDQTIGIVIGNGIGITCRVASVTETAEVRVQSECDEPWVSMGGSAALHLTVTRASLASPLGQRVVLDGRGVAASKCDTEAACP
jgi:hypothetical protein